MKLADFKKLNKSTGHHFFDKDASMFFRSKIESKMIGECYFVTSEQFSADSERFYTVRRANSDGSVTTLSEFQEYKSLHTAIAQATLYASTTWAFFYACEGRKVDSITALTLAQAKTHFYRLHPEFKDRRGEIYTEVI